MNTWSQTDGVFVLGCHVVLIWHILNMVHDFYSDKSLMSIKLIHVFYSDKSLTSI